MLRGNRRIRPAAAAAAAGRKRGRSGGDGPHAGLKEPMTTAKRVGFADPAHIAGI